LSQPAASETNTSQARVRLALITIQVLFGVNYLTSKLVVDVMEPGAWASLRTLAALVVLGGLLLIRRTRLPGLKDSALLGVAAFFGVVLNQGLFLEGLHRTTVGRAALICSLIPIFVLLFSVLGRQERVTLRKGLGFAAGMLGVLILLEADRFRFDGRYLRGDLLVLANAACYGFYLVFSKPVMKRNDPLAASTVVFFFGAAGMSLYGGQALLATPRAVFSPVMLLTMAYVVLGATVATYF
jgi:drug/metabolite transporter (DMT)-like permease